MTYEDIKYFNERNKKDFYAYCNYLYDNYEDKSGLRRLKKFLEYSMEIKDNVIVFCNSNNESYEIKDIMDIMYFYERPNVYVKNISLLKNNMQYIERKIRVDNHFFTMLLMYLNVKECNLLAFKRVNNLKNYVAKCVLNGYTVIEYYEPDLIYIIYAKYDIYIVSDCTICFKNDYSYRFDSVRFKRLYIDNIDVSELKDIKGMFSNCKFVKSITLKNFDTRNCILMGSLFYNCINLEELNINFDTHNVLFFNNMFSSCFSLVELHLNNFNFSSAQNMENMFADCINLESLEIPYFDKTSLKNSNNMFLNCNKLRNINYC